MSHVCSTALIRCMDFRLGPAIRDYMNANDLYGDCDIISVAGAAKDIAQATDSYVEGLVHLSKRLHDTKTVLLMNHTDCGAYGGRAAFGSDEEERAKHLADMRTAKAKILAKQPEMNVKLVLAKIVPDGSVSIEEIE